MMIIIVVVILNYRTVDISSSRVESTSIQENEQRLLIACLMIIIIHS